MQSSEWYAIRVKSNRERVTATALTGKGYEVFLPECKKGVDACKPQLNNSLFPGYLFARFDLYRRLPILVIPGVVHIVGIGRTPMPIDPDEIETLRVVTEAGLPVDRDEPYTVGQKIMVAMGPLSGASGVITDIKGLKLVVSITLLQRSVSVAVQAEWLTVQPGGMSKPYQRPSEYNLI